MCKNNFKISSYMFHYVTEEGVIFLCITGDVKERGGREGGREGKGEERKVEVTCFSTAQDFERSRAFMFLEHIKSE